MAGGKVSEAAEELAEIGVISGEKVRVTAQLAELVVRRKKTCMYSACAGSEKHEVYLPRSTDFETTNNVLKLIRNIKLMDLP